MLSEKRVSPSTAPAGLHYVGVVACVTDALDATQLICSSGDEREPVEAGKSVPGRHWQGSRVECHRRRHQVSTRDERDNCSHRLMGGTLLHRAVVLFTMCSIVLCEVPSMLWIVGRSSLYLLDVWMDPFGEAEYPC